MTRQSARDDAFVDFVRRRRAALLGNARALTSGDAHLAEDLVQTALTRLYVAWPRIRPQHLDSYVRRMLVNALVDESRRPTRREVARADVPDQALGDTTDGIDTDLLEALRLLPVRMRTAVVLRHVEGLSVRDTAHAMRCSTGTVKSQTARGLDRLRAHLTVEESSWS